jgi:site-specific recombinase XerD
MTERKNGGTPPWAAAVRQGQQNHRFDDSFVGHPPTVLSRVQRLASLPWLASWMQQLKSENKSIHTVRSYLISAKGLASATLPGEPNLSDSAIEHMNVQIMHKRIDPNNGRIDVWMQSLSHLAPSTVHARLAGATHLLKWLGYHIPDHIVRPKKGKHLPRPLEPDELTRLRAVAQISENPLANVVVTVLLQTGLRVSELCALDDRDVNVHTLSARVSSGKGDKDRMVMFSGSGAEVIGCWRRHRNGRRTCDRDAFLVNSRGNRLTSRNVQKLMDRLADDSDIPRSRLSPHTLRHNFATGLLNGGADIVSIQKLMGHTNITATRVYLDVTDPALREVYNRAQANELEELLSRERDAGTEDVAEVETVEDADQISIDPAELA